ncbi:MAG: hypothetical protein IAE89_07600 [Anaerolineae bacterium]|nr:hypothetical protein [Anaerolineae bacterium]
MQETRRLILDILRHRGFATVDEIVEHLREQRGDEITSVTVRHHLTRLQEEDLIAAPQLRRRSSPGRPQHVYTLSSKAREQFSNNYQHIFCALLDEIRNQLSPTGVNVLLEGVTNRWSQEAGIGDVPMCDRMNLAVDYLNQHGYDAQWEMSPEGYILHTANCPYHAIVSHNEALCEMDLRLVASLVNAVPRRLAHISSGDTSCSYLIPESKAAEF